MTLTLSTPNETYDNAAALGGAPAVVLAAFNVTLNNLAGGLIESTLAASPAIRIDGAAGSIINAAGGTIRAAGGVATALAVTGSAGDDTVDNAGTLVGAVSLGDGGDTFIARALSDGRIDFGGGNDSFLINFAAANRATLWTPTADGGAGVDTVSVAGVETARGGGLSNFESLIVGATVTNLEDFSGYAAVSLAANGSNIFLRANNPNADLALNGNQLTLNTGSVFRSVTGSAGAELVELLGNGANAGRVTGAVALGAGNDIVRLSASGANPLPVVAGTLDGGAGTDVLGIALRNGGTVNVAAYTGFEVIDTGTWTSGISSFRLVNANNYLELYADQRGAISIGRSTIGVVVPGALGALTIEGTTTIGRIGFSGPNAQPDDRAAADPALNLSITNIGTITGVAGQPLGAVNLWYGHDLFDGRDGVQNGVIAGYAGNDTIYGGAGAETLDGGQGADSLFGEDGDDVVIGAQGSDVLDGGSGADSLLGGDGADVLIGGVGDDVLDGGVGADTASYERASGGVVVDLGGGASSGGDGVDVLISIENVIGSVFADVLVGSVDVANVLVGGSGSDVYVVHDGGDVVVEAAGSGGGLRDEVYAFGTYYLDPGAGVEVLSAAGQAAVVPLALAGNAFAQELYGNAGANTLNGGGGADTMVGFAGSDIYFVDDAGDVVAESAGGGVRDEVYAFASWQLGAGSAVEVVSAANQAGLAALALAGNEFAQELYGNAGANTLNGGGGADVMVGFAGNDIYFVDNADDVVAESAGAGGGLRDEVYAQASFELGAGSGVEVLSAANQAGSAPLALVGNELAQEIYGNAGANTLVGGGGADTMVGFAGSDVYLVDDLLDVVVEAAGAAGGARDEVYAAVSYALGAGAGVEVLSAAGQGATTALALLGNAFAQEVYGNAGANRLDGGGGADTLVGLGGADVFAFTSAIGAGNVDLVADFSVAQGDRISLGLSAFAGIAQSATGGLLNAQAFALTTDTPTTDTRILYNPQTGHLLFDPDGSGTQQATHFATLATTPQELTATNFTVG